MTAVYSSGELKIQQMCCFDLNVEPVIPVVSIGPYRQKI
jgi:hypothetical protein